MDSRVSNQIAVYKTSKNLIESLDKLKQASPNNYAKIHSGTDEMYNNHKLISCIGLKIGSYEVKPAKYVEANISPIDVNLLYQHATRAVMSESKMQNMSFLSQTKIIGAAQGTDGRAPVKKLTIQFVKLAGDGTARRSPISVSIENGTGVPMRTKTGGTNCQNGTYKIGNKISIWMSTDKFYEFIWSTKRFLDAFEIRAASVLYKEGHKLWIEQAAARKAEAEETSEAEEEIAEETPEE